MFPILVSILSRERFPGKKNLLPGAAYTEKPVGLRMKGARKVTTEEIEGNPEETLNGRFLTFILGDEVYGIEIRYVTEIIGIQLIHKLPEISGYIRGVINLRGRIIPVVDMRLKFKKEELAYSDRTCIVVVETGQTVAGLIVDQVAEVLTIEDIVPPPGLQGQKCRSINGIGKVNGEVKLLLDCETLFSEEETELWNQIQDGGAEQ
jgi:purine-binding chemotaxis protein CheW